MLVLADNDVGAMSLCFVASSNRPRTRLHSRSSDLNRVRGVNIINYELLDVS